MNTLKWAVLPEKQCDVHVDLLNPEKCQVQGAFYLNLSVGTETGKLLVYIPQGWRNNDEVLVLAPPSDQKEEDFLTASGLLEFSEAKHIMVALLVREAGKMPGQEAELFNAAYKKLQGREYFVAMQDCFYAMGVGDGSPAVIEAMVSMGSNWSGAAFFGGLAGISSKQEERKSQPQEAQTEEMFLSRKKAQLPVWILDENETPELESLRNYWIAENRDLEEPVYDKRGTAIYGPKPLSRISSINDAPIAQVRVTLGFNFKQLSAQWWDYVWSYVGAARRHRSYGNKILRYYRNPDCTENGATYHSLVIDGMKREWYEYVPQGMEKQTRPLPLVVVFHGRGGNGQSFFDITDMSVVAQERGFIALFPTADIYQIRPEGYRGVRIWNGEYNGTPIDSMPFVRAMVEDVKKRFPVDKSRIYACGQSSGGHMSVCCAFQAPDLFAAVAPWSGFTYPGMKRLSLPAGAPTTLDGVPLYLLVGKEDNLFGVSSIDLENPSCDLEYFLLFVLKSYNLELQHDSYVCYPIEYHVWRKNGVPMLTLGLVEDLPHANYPEESRISYDDFMCRFSMDANGMRRFMGRRIERE